MLAAPMALQPYFRDFDDLGPSNVVSQNLQAASQVAHDVQSSDNTLDILSAAIYPFAPSRSTRKRQLSSQLLGGLISKDNEQEDDVNRGQPRKKSRNVREANSECTHDDSDSSHKKQRGRPRLEPRDETAADRRRTQIRLAQRAYRDRKESTVSTLRSQVEELRHIIEKMNSAFTQLHDNAINSDIHFSSRNDVLTQQLKGTMEEFTELARKASIDPEQMEETDKIAKLNKAKIEIVPLSDKNLAELDDSNKNYGTYASPPVTVTSHQIEQEIVDEDLGGNEIELLSTRPSNSNLQSKLDVARWSGQIERPIQTDGSYTYSFQETTFARRLHRAALELGYRQMSNPTLDPAYVQHAFRFTFTFSNRRRVLHRFQELLKRKAGESLENWNIPFFYIGGAGTHFPRHDDRGNAVYPPNLVGAAKALGPLEHVNVESRMSGKTTEELLQTLGFDGVWFDSHDVEGYLKTRGIHLDAQSSFVRVDASILPKVPKIPTQTEPSRTLGVQYDSVAGLNTEQIRDLQDASKLFDMPDLSFHPSGTELSGSDMAIWNWSGMEDDEYSSSNTVHDVGNNHNARRRSVNFDVEMFLARLTAKGVCLGRAPGFKRSDVDEAVIYATQEAF